MEITQLSDSELMGALTPSVSSMSDADLLKAIGEKPAQTSGTAADIAKSAVAGVGEGLTGLAGLPADIANLGAKGIDYLGGTNLQQYTQSIADTAGGGAIQKYVEKYTGPFYKPQTGGGQVAQTFGQFLPAVVGGPETLLTKLATRVAAPALASEAAGKVTEGTPLEPYARVGGAVLGAASPVALSRAISPATIAPERQAAVDLLQSKGVPLDAAMQSGNKAMGYLHSELGDALGAGNKATNSNEVAARGFTSAALKDGGVVGAPQDFTPAAVNANLADMKNGFNSIAAKYTEQNPIAISPDFKSRVDDIVSTFKDNQGHPPSIIQTMMSRLGFNQKNASIPENINDYSEKAKQQILKAVGAVKQEVAITGKQYQAVSSDVAAALRNATNGDLKFALGKFKSALDDAVQNNLAAPDQGVWQQLRQRWLNHLILEDAVKSSAETAAQGLITPAKLETSIQKFTKTGYTRGTNQLEPLARAGNQVMKQLPQSGTAPRAAARAFPALAGAALGGHFGLIPGMVAGVAGPALLGRAIYSRPVQAYLKNQKAVGLRQLPLGRRLATSGILALPQVQQ